MGMMAQLDSEVDMPRFIQEEFNPKKKEDKPIVKPKPGKYTCLLYTSPSPRD